MNLTALFHGINWRTTGFAIGYIVCNIVAFFVPSVADTCSILDKIFVAGGFVSAADSSRLETIVQAVDHISWKNGVDPSTLQSTTPPTTEAPVPHVP
jgi:hypothetical protein